MAGPDQPVLRLRGGVTLPSEIMLRLNASWPLGLLVITDEGIEISATWFPDRWSATWEDLERAMASPTSVLLIPKTGRGARFRPTSYVKLKPLLDSLERHGVPIEKVRSTYKAAWTL